MEKQQRMGWEPVSPTWRKHKNPIRVEDTDSHPTQENIQHMRQDPRVKVMKTFADPKRQQHQNDRSNGTNP